MESFKNPLVTLLLLLILLSITLVSYWPGINGLFIFDDIPNLSPMGKYPNLDGWGRFILFLLEGNSGPTGRPVSLASFYLNDNTWPSHPSYFTLTNILIHLLNGLLVFWFSYKLSVVTGLSRIQQNSFPLIATALWILHPFHSTTVLYVVQRMTELSALFTLAGLIFYLYGREKLVNKPVTGLFQLFLGVGISLLLSIFSKENGILLVAYILVIEFFLLQPLKISTPRYYYYWLTPAIIIPFIILLAYLAQRAWQGGGFENRDFTLSERLLTESRIIFDYLNHILLPSNGTTGIFHDDYVISKDLLTPWTTLPSVVGVLTLIVLAFLLRKNKPLFAFAIVWFFAGHLLESTVLSLELYFEHRNYLPMLGFLIAIAWYASKYFLSYRVPILVITCTTLALFGFLIIQNAVLWSKPLELSVNWYHSHPNSVRAQEAYLNFMKPLDITQNKFSNEQLLIRNKSSYTVLWNLKEACDNNEITGEMLDSSIHILRDTVIHASTATALMEFVSKWLDGSCKNIKHEQIESFITKLTKIKGAQTNTQFLHVTHFWLSEIHFKNKDLHNTMINLKKAYQLIPSIGLLKVQVKYLLSAGLNKEALAVINDTSLLENGLRKRLAYNIRRKEIDDLKKIITSRLKNN